MAWRETHLNQQLKEKVSASDWFISADNETVGKVINIVYAGYKIQLPDNTERIINPSTSKIVDLSSEDYENFRKEWLERKEKQNIAQNIAKKQAEEEEAKLAEKQRNCLHKQLKEDSIKTAGCDIDTLSCVSCRKVLFKSWSTYMDNDPLSHVSDWDWYIRYCHAKHNGFTPRVNDYLVVEKIFLGL